MAIYLATKTLQAIEDAVARDGGAAYRVMLGKVMPHIGDAYRGGDSGFRSHLGASLIGRECGRELWYGFRWVMKQKFSGRMLRLFNRGHMEEGRFIAMMLVAGMRVIQQDAEGNQFRISRVGGHLGGSGDGIVYGCPDIPEGQVCLSEFKTHGEKSFVKLVKEGVEKAKHEHFVQMQSYMLEMGLWYALYVAVNKNTDELYAEIIMREDHVAHQFLERGEKIIFMQSPPPRISSTPAFFKCKFCNYSGICHKGEPVERNCRTCMYSQPMLDGTWHCQKYNCTISKELQLASCNDYTVIGDI